MDRAPDTLEPELRTLDALELRVLAGPQAGARAALAAGSACVLAAGAQGHGADIVLHDEGGSPARVRITADAQRALIEVLHGEVGLGEQVLAAGAHAPWPRHAPLRIAGSTVAFGLACEDRWGADEPAPAAAAQAPVRQPPGRRAEVWLGATGAAILLACGGTLWMAHVAAASPVATAPAPRVAAAARDDSAVAREVAEVFRVNGVAVRARSVAPGQIVAEAAERDTDKLARAEEAVRRDVRGFDRLTVRNAPEPLPAPARPAVEEPGKRIASIVPGDPGYVVTADGANYFVGSLLPSGDRIVQVAPGRLTLERAGHASTLNF